LVFVDRFQVSCWVLRVLSDQNQREGFKRLQDDTNVERVANDFKDSHELCYLSTQCAVHLSKYACKECQYVDYLIQEDDSLQALSFFLTGLSERGGFFEIWFFSDYNDD